MAQVKQVRVVRNVLWCGVLCVFALWLVRDRVWEHRQALGTGVMVGALGGWCWWRSLSRTIARRDRRYERNKIFVHYLSLLEVAIAAVAYNPVLALPLGVVLLAVVVGPASAPRRGEYRKSNGLFHRPQHGVSPHAPRQRLASPVGSRQATGPRRRARTGRVAGDGQPALLGLRGGDCCKLLWGTALRA